MKRTVALPQRRAFVGNRGVTRQPGEGSPAPRTPQAIGETVAREWAGRIVPFPIKRIRLRGSRS